METFFYVMGGILVLLALVISAIGMKSKDFPSAGVLRVGVLIVALVVGATAFGAVELSQEEAGHRLDEENIEAAEEAEVTTEENAAEAGGGPNSGSANIDDGDETSEGRKQAADDAANGEEVFLAEGCGGCHSLAALGDQAGGTVGPNLDEALVDKDAEYIETSIVEPDAEIAEGFGEGIMPDDYEQVLDDEQLQSLVAYLQQATQGNAGSGGGNSN